jgi:ketosteroid isomerase-like protein
MSANPAVPMPAPQNVQAEIRKLNQRFVDAVNQGDVEGALANYLPDARVLPPHFELAHGRDAIRRLFQQFVSAGMTGLTLETGSVQTEHHFTIETGKFTIRVPQPDGRTVTDRGKYVVAWQRQPNGELRITTDIWNSDLPPTGS